MAEDRRDLWKTTSIGLVIAAIVAVVTGIVVANRTSTTETKVTAPSASPSATVAQAPTTPAAQPATPAPATSAPAQTGVPSQSAVAECNRVAAAQGGPVRSKNDKITDTAKDAGIGALGGAAVGALGGAIASGGKGALIGGGVGAGAGTLYGIYDDKKHDEAYRSAYVGCMKAKGYTG